MHLIHQPFWWPRRCTRAIQTRLPNAACPGLLRKPLDTAIGQQLAPYYPSGRQGNRQTNNNQQNTPTKLAVSMVKAMRRYITACIPWWRRSRASLEPTGCCHWASIMSNNIKNTWLRQFKPIFFILKTIEKGQGSTLRPLFLIGVDISIKRAWLN